jgi:drug/metabolite transporter (DMT)-like permease
MHARALLVLAALGSVWGGSFLFIKVIVEETSPLTLVAGRLTLGALPVLAWTFVRRPSIAAPASIVPKAAVIAALGNAVPFVLISWGEQRIDSDVAAVLNGTMPLWTALVTAAVLPRERLSVMATLGLLAGFGGVVVLTGPDIVQITGSGTLGNLAVVAAASLYAVSLVFTRATLSREDPLLVAALQLTLGAAMMWPLAFAASGGSPDISVSPHAWASWLALGFLGTGIANVAYLWLVNEAGVITSTVTYIPPVVGLLLGAALLDEPIGLSSVAGAALILGGVAVVTGRAGTLVRMALRRTDAPVLATGPAGGGGSG